MAIYDAVEGNALQCERGHSSSWIVDGQIKKCSGVTLTWITLTKIFLKLIEDDRFVSYILFNKKDIRRKYSAWKYVNGSFLPQGVGLGCYFIYMVLGMGYHLQLGVNST